MLQPCIVCSCSSGVHDVATRILGKEYSSKYVGVAAALAASQKDIDRIGAGHYTYCNFCTQTSIGLCTPREPPPKLLCNLCMSSASILT